MNKFEALLEAYKETQRHIEALEEIGGMGVICATVDARERASKILTLLGEEHDADT